MHVYSCAVGDRVLWFIVGEVIEYPTVDAKYLIVNVQVAQTWIQSSYYNSKPCTASQFNKKHLKMGSNYSQWIFIICHINLSLCNISRKR